MALNKDQAKIALGAVMSAGQDDVPGMVKGLAEQAKNSLDGILDQAYGKGLDKNLEKGYQSPTPKRS